MQCNAMQCNTMLPAIMTYLLAHRKTASSNVTAHGTFVAELP